MYKNGVSQGEAWTDIPKGSYYPCFSLYKHASVSRIESHIIALLIVLLQMGCNFIISIILHLFCVVDYCIIYISSWLVLIMVLNFISSCGIITFKQSTLFKAYTMVYWIHRNINANIVIVLRNNPYLDSNIQLYLFPMSNLWRLSTSAHQSLSRSSVKPKTTEENSKLFPR